MKNRSRLDIDKENENFEKRISALEKQIQDKNLQIFISLYEEIERLKKIINQKEIEYLENDISDRSDRKVELSLPYDLLLTDKEFRIFSILYKSGQKFTKTKDLTSYFYKEITYNNKRSIIMSTGKIKKKIAKFELEIISHRIHGYRFSNQSLKIINNWQR